MFKDEIRKIYQFKKIIRVKKITIKRIRIKFIGKINSRRMKS